MVVAEELEVKESVWERDVQSKDSVTHIPPKTTGDLIYTDLRGTGQGNMFPFSPTLSPSLELNCIMGAKEQSRLRLSVCTLIKDLHHPGRFFCRG